MESDKVEIMQEHLKKKKKKKGSLYRTGIKQWLKVENVLRIIFRMEIIHSSYKC